MKITKQWLVRHEACALGQEWFKNTFTKPMEATAVIRRLHEDNNFSWAVWLLLHILSHRNRVRIAVHAALLDLAQHHTYTLYERRLAMTAIEAAKRCLVSNTDRNRIAAAIAGRTAYCAVPSIAIAAVVACDSGSRYETVRIAISYPRTPQQNMPKIINFGLKLLRTQHRRKDSRS